MSEKLYLVTILLVAGTFLAVAFLRLASARAIERSKASKEDDYRHLAEQVASQELAVSSKLATIQAGLDQLQERVAGIERILSQVG
jgi:hypothetical protein